MTLYGPTATALLLLVTLTASPALAQGLRERMAERKPAVDALLAKGTIGENNVGFLEYIEEELEIEVVREQNADRLILYKAIGRKTDKTFIEVGRRLCVLIHEKAPAGTWLQSREGKWYRKQ